MQKRQFHTLDGLRGVAALAVITRHVPNQALGEWLPGSYLAVDLFFALSGFVLAYNYMGRLGRGLSTASFMTARFIRLYPLYFLGSAAGAVVAVLSRLPGTSDPVRMVGTIATALVFLPTMGRLSIDHLHPYPFDNLAWSLFFELLINFAFALIALRLGKRSLAIVIGIGALMIVGAAIRLGSLDAGWRIHGFYVGGCRVVYDFFIGVLLHRLWAAGRIRVRVPAFLPIVLMLGIFAVPAAVGWQRVVFDIMAALVLLPALLAISIESEPSGSLLTVFGLLGAASYPAYITQGAIIGVIELAVHGTLISYGTGGTLFVMVLVTAIALALNRYVDPPLRAWLRRVIDRLTSSPRKMRDDAPSQLPQA